MADALTSTGIDTSPPPDPTNLATYRLDKTITLDGDVAETLSILTAVATDPNLLSEVFDPDADQETILTITVRGFKRLK